MGDISGLKPVSFADDGTFPNSVLPLLYYRAAISPAATTPEALEALFAENGWPPQWRSVVFTYHHYHSTAHEVLGIASGAARLHLGGPEGEIFEVVPGDVILIPAGVAHKRVSSTPDFLVVGAYPPAQSWDLLNGTPGERPTADANIAKVPLPRTDPVGGGTGGVITLWRGASV